MASLVDKEVRALAEGLPAERALVWLLPRMAPLVINEALARVEAAPALCTFVGFLHVMGPLVEVKVGTLAEGFAADGTFIVELLLTRGTFSFGKGRVWPEGFH